MQPLENVQRGKEALGFPQVTKDSEKKAGGFRTQAQAVANDIGFGRDCLG